MDRPPQQIQDDLAAAPDTLRGEIDALGTDRPADGGPSSAGGAPPDGAPPLVGSGWWRSCPAWR